MQNLATKNELFNYVYEHIFIRAEIEITVVKINNPIESIKYFFHDA